LLAHLTQQQQRPANARAGSSLLRPSNRR
jgi:hypothetical protein